MTARKNKLIFQNSIGETVRAWRQERNLTLVALGQRAGMSKGYLSLLENSGVDRPDDDHLVRLAKALEIPVEYLVNRVLPGDKLLGKEREIVGEHVLTEAERSILTHPVGEEVGLSGFAAPVPLQSEEDAQLRLILEKFEELQNLVIAFINRRGR